MKPASGQRTSVVSKKSTVRLFTPGAKKYGDMDNQQLKRLKELEDENRRLKRMFADLSLDHQLLKEVLEKKF